MAKKKKFGWRMQIAGILLILCGILFSAVSLVMLVGMVPSFVAAAADRTKGRYQTITVGSLNFAGCLPFMVDVLKHGNNIPAAIDMITEPRTIVIMYAAAGAGYLIDWAMTGIVSAVLVQKAKVRLRQIEKTQKDMVEKWGPEVTGKVALDEYGFPRGTGASADENG